MLAPMGPDEDAQVCENEGCGRLAVYHLVKLAGASEQEKFFCQEHGTEFANRGHLAISDNV